MRVPVILSLNTDLMYDMITLNHGSGGLAAGKLIREMFAQRFGMDEPLTDSALIEAHNKMLAFTTDSYVVDPVFFPGGNIGKLAVCGTINDLCVAGAIPEYLSAAFIIEEGFPVDELRQIVDSMSEESRKAGVRIVTGDTKVVERGKCDRIFITTSGTGIIRPGFEHAGTAEKVMEGDCLLINGPLGNHSIAVLGARKELSFTSPVISDCASLKDLISDIIGASANVHFMRDLTRGGLASVLNELVQMIPSGIVVDENSVPVDAPVAGLCEMFGFDPLYLANEGKLLVVVPEEDCEKVLKVMKGNPLGIGSCLIGRISGETGNRVVLNTFTGGRKILDLPSGTMLPRIC